MPPHPPACGCFHGLHRGAVQLFSRIIERGPAWTGRTAAANATTTATIRDVTLTTPPPPTTTIVAPSSGAPESVGLPFALGAFVVDDQNVARCSDPAWSFAWVDQTSGTALASACNGSATLTTPGAHTLAFTATGPRGSATSTVTVDVSVAVALQASITSPPPANGDLVAASASCLPTPPFTLSGAGAGGSPPYTYQWTVQPLPAAGSAPPPAIFATTPSAITAAFPSNWLSLLSPVETQSTGEPVNLMFQVTDSTGARAAQLEHVRWLCAPPRSKPRAMRDAGRPGIRPAPPDSKRPAC